MTAIEEKSAPQSMDEQVRLLEAVPVGDIARGCHIPITLFEQFRQLPPIYFEMGAGSGEKAKKIRRRLNAVVLVADINGHAVDQAEALGLIGVHADVRRYLFDAWGRGACVNVEMHPHVYYEGLLCNQRGSDWKKILRVSELALLPTGYLLFADIGRVDRPHSALRDAFTSEAEFQQYVRAWVSRYELNQQAAKLMGIEIADSEFMVAKPGTNKRRELGSAEELIALHDSGDFERWAQHMDYQQVLQFLLSLGLQQLHHEDTVFYSREGLVLPGFIDVWRKGPVFNYSPYYLGLTREEAEGYAAKGPPALSLEECRNQLIRVIPDIEELFPGIK